ncbi:lactonase family protein [Sphingobacterium sp. SRCM116780]|uniref:lactonase family protein n=1 Tax=Sphingobacterium sp. SRCM116780 TaxID=2907623 RepID=UPI001F19C3FB|nr:lactonase family protein [Sphingobacterium sp. SRCM116780]UIR56253.1 lactonase family protein [Sphingobacterium sp. SRCM116780]
MKKIILFILTCFPFFCWSQKISMFVGTYTSNTQSKGIYAFDFNTKTGEIELISTISMVNPSFLARKDNILYAVSEQEQGSLAAYSFSQEKFTLLNTVSTKGANPCHVSVSPNNNLIAVSNYSGGSFLLYGLESNGVIGDIKDFVQHEGAGIDKVRQAGPHVHSAFFSKKGDELFVQDLGLDQISIYRLINPKKSTIKLGQDPEEVFSSAGGGPRHIVFDKKGKYMYVVLEMTADIAVYEREGSDWLFYQSININPDGFSGQNGAADIKVSPDGKFLYATNRGDANTIGIFAVGRDGKLIKVANQSTKGKGPRNFNISPDGKFLLVANQTTNEIVVFNRDEKTGLLTDSGKTVSIPSPVCIIF